MWSGRLSKMRNAFSKRTGQSHDSSLHRWLSRGRAFNLVGLPTLDQYGRRIVKSKLAILAALVLPLLILGTYISTQEPKLSVSPEFTAIILLKGGYRSWSVSICDGYVWDI